MFVQANPLNTTSPQIFEVKTCPPPSPFHKVFHHQSQFNHNLTLVLTPSHRKEWVVLTQHITWPAHNDFNERSCQFMLTVSS